MKRFMLFNQDEEPICELEYDKFNAAVIELGSGYFVVNIVPHADGRSYPVAVYRDVVEAAQAVQELRDFAFAVTTENQGFAMPVSDEPVTALEVVDLLT